MPDSPAYFSDVELWACTNGYASDRRKGAGGFGTVYAGYNLRDFEQVAVKRVERRGCSVSDWECKKRTCRRELAVSKRCEHPCLVKVVGITNNPKGKDCAIVYTPLARCSLMDVLDCEPIWSPEASLRACRDVAHALAALHRKRIVHADVKTQNVLLRGSGDATTCMLADFGSSRVIRSGDSILLDHDDSTYPYWSPEYRNEGVLSTGMDVFSMGLLMLELFSWVLAFTDPSGTAQRVEALTTGDEKAIREMAVGAWDHELRSRFAALAGRCLATDRRIRPTAAECAAALDDMLAGSKKRKRDQSS